MQLICGMHRSGTSLVGQIAHKAGANFGNQQDFWPADRWNPQGYFEQKDIIAINKKLINGRLGKFHYFFPPDENLIAKRVRSCEAELKLLAQKYADNVVKENRFCLTLGEWLIAGAHITRILIVVRHPIGVARSLRKRYHLPAVISDRLWYTHLQRLENTIVHIPTKYLWYDDFVSSPAGTQLGLEKIAWLTGLDISSLHNAAEGVIRPLNSASQPPSRIIAPPLQDLYTELVRKSRINDIESND